MCIPNILGFGFPFWVVAVYKDKVSPRKFVIRGLLIFSYARKHPGDKKIGRCRIAAFRHDKPLCNAVFTPRSSSRSVLVRDIAGVQRAAHTLYPGVAVRRTRHDNLFVVY